MNNTLHVMIFHKIVDYLNNTLRYLLRGRIPLKR